MGRTNRYVGGNEYFTINFARSHCSNCEHFRPAGAKPQGVTINYDGVMPQSIYYAAHRMPPQMIPTCLHARALYARRPSTSLRFRCVTGRTPCWRGGRPVTRSPMRAGNPVERHVCSFRIRRCVHLDKLAALNLTSFISSKRRSNASP